MHSKFNIMFVMTMKKKRRKIQKKNLLIVVVAVACVVGLISSAGFWTVSSIQKHQKKQEVAAQDEQKITELKDLKVQVQDILSIKYLAHLKSDIQTFLFNNQLSDLQDQINQYFEENNIDQTKVAYAIQDLTTDAYVESDNARENYPAASTYKLPLSMLWYEMIQSGAANPENKLEYTEKMREDEDGENPNQPIGKMHKIGDQIRLAEVLEAAALYSDNIAGHMLFENLGGYSAFKSMALKYARNQQAQEFTDYKNILNPDYTMDLAHALFNDQTGTWDDLKYWLYRAYMGGFLNRNQEYGFVQKIGNNQEVRNVIGYLPGNAPFSISIYSSIGADEGEKMIGDLGSICVDYFTKKYESGFYDDYPKKDYDGWEFLQDPPQITIYYDYDTGTGEIVPDSQNSSSSQNQNDQNTSSENSSAQNGQ